MAQLSQARVSSPPVERSVPLKTHTSSSPIEKSEPLKDANSRPATSIPLVDQNELLTATTLPEPRTASSLLIDKGERRTDETESLDSELSRLLVDRREPLEAEPSSSLVNQGEPPGSDVGSLLVNRREPLEPELSRPLVVESESPAPGTSSPSVDASEPPDPNSASLSQACAGASSTQPTPLRQKQLAERLCANESTLWRKRQNSDFADWTRNHDPDGVAWEYRPAKKGIPQYFPLLWKTINSDSTPSWDAKVNSFLDEVSRK